jgi:hypothetical protein
MTSFLALTTEAKMSPEVAQKLVDLQVQSVATATTAAANEFAAQQAAWQAAVKADAEIGGDKLPAVLADAKKVIERYGSKELAQTLSVTGAGNNLSVIKFLHNLSKVILEQPPASTGSPSPGRSTTFAERMYGSK